MAWEEVPIKRVTYEGMYADAPGYGTFVVEVYAQTYRVCASWTANTGNDYYKLEDCLNYIKTLTGDKIVQVAAGTYTILDGVEVPPNTKILGGFPDKFAETGHKLILRDPRNKDYIAKVSSSTSAAPIPTRPVFFISRQPATNDYNYNTIIDGLYFLGFANKVTVLSTVNNIAGALVIWGHTHVKNIHIRNCTFDNNIGRIGGSVYAVNCDKVFFESCSFVNNYSTAGGEFAGNDPISYGCYACAYLEVMVEDPVNPGNFIKELVDLTPLGYGTGPESKWSGGAVTLWNINGCGSETEFDGCVFWNNTTGFDNNDVANANGGTIAIYDASDKYRPIKVINCTFNKNIVKGVVTGGTGNKHDLSAGGVYVYGPLVPSGKASPIIIMNSILWGNSGTGSAAYEISGITNATSVPYNVNAEYQYWSGGTFLPGDEITGGVTLISYCNIQQAGFAGTNGNINVDPQFEYSDFSNDIDKIWGTQDDILRPKYVSASRDVGKWDGLAEHRDSDPKFKDYYKPTYFDVAGRPKLGDVDMGAYESYIKILCVGDDLTRGKGENTSPWTYRASLNDQLARMLHWNVAFVGSLESAPIGAPPSGWNPPSSGTDVMLPCRNLLGPQPNPAVAGTYKNYNVLHNGKENSSTNYYNVDQPITPILTAQKPDVVLFMTGSYETHNTDVSNMTPEQIDALLSVYATNISTTITSVGSWMGNQGIARGQRILFVGKTIALSKKGPFMLS